MYYFFRTFSFYLSRAPKCLIIIGFSSVQQKSPRNRYTKRNYYYFRHCSSWRLSVKMKNPYVCYVSSVRAELFGATRNGFALSALRCSFNSYVINTVYSQFKNHDNIRFLLLTSYHVYTNLIKKKKNTYARAYLTGIKIITPGRIIYIYKTLLNWNNEEMNMYAHISVTREMPFKQRKIYAIYAIWTKFFVISTSFSFVYFYSKGENFYDGKRIELEIIIVSCKTRLQLHAQSGGHSLRTHFPVSWYSIDLFFALRTTSFVLYGLTKVIFFFFKSALQDVQIYRELEKKKKTTTKTICLNTFIYLLSVCLLSESFDLWKKNARISPPPSGGCQVRCFSFLFCFLKSFIVSFRFFFNIFRNITLWRRDEKM